MAPVLCLRNLIVHFAGFTMRCTTEYTSLCNTWYVGEVTVTSGWLLVSICAGGWSKYNALLIYCTEHVQQQTFKMCNFKKIYIYI